MSPLVRATILLITAPALFLLGSCGSGLPASDQVVATVTPATATVAVGGTVALEGNATGFTSSPIVTWRIQEAHETGGDDCAYLTLPATSPCPFGYVVFGSVTEFPSPSIYYAPITTGTYHVTFSATQNTTFDYLTKTATATITVTQ